MLNENNHKRKSLGRGLGALLGDDAFLLGDEVPAVSENGGGIKKIALTLLQASNYQPRTDFDK